MSHYADPRLKQVIQDLIDSADGAGCTEDLTVASSKYIEYAGNNLHLCHGWQAWRNQKDNGAKGKGKTSSGENKRFSRTAMIRDHDPVLSSVRRGSPEFRAKNLSALVAEHRLERYCMSLTNYRSLALSIVHTYYSSAKTKVRVIGPVSHSLSDTAKEREARTNIN